ncbi:MAG: condensation domain-containing protein [Spirochaetales bacterium]|nr:condensation domain-containing protein [Spirochaetales bacterium]
MITTYKMTASVAQKRLWFFEQRYPNTQLYHILLEFELSGDFNEKEFTRALKYIIQRHESLRTSFMEKDGELYQVIHEEVNLENNILGCTSTICSKEEYRSEYDSLSAQTFDFEKAPLFRAKVFQLEHNFHKVLLIFHHIIIDGWSIEIFIKELAKVYNKYVNKEVPELEELEIQYSDYSEWISEWLNNGERERSMKFWDGKFSEGYKKIQILYPLSKKTEKLFEGGYIERKVDRKMGNRINEFIKVNRGSLFSIFLSTFAGTLSYLGNIDEIVLGTVASGRLSNELLDVMVFPAQA